MHSTRPDLASRNRSKSIIHIVMKLASHRYGKARVRVAKIFREQDRQSIKQIEVMALLQGDFESSYTAGDNRKVVPTDTIKNTINVLAKDQLGEEIEQFAIVLGEHFLQCYEQVRTARIEISERHWHRMNIDGKPHPHSFEAGSDAKMFTRVVFTRESQTVESGIRDFVILKSTASGFENYPKDEFTTLPETSDRILAISFSATWTLDKLPKDCRAANQSVLTAMLDVFAENYSPSAQTTLYQMGEAALNACP